MDTYLYLYWAGWPWPLTTEKEEASSSHHVDQLYQVVRSWTNGSVFILPTMYPAMSSTYVAIRLWPLISDLEKTLCIFFSPYWLIVQSCMILELTIHSVSCLQHFPTKWQYDLDLWPATLQNNRHFLSSCWSNVRNCKILKLMVRLTRPGQIDGHTDGRR